MPIHLLSTHRLVAVVPLTVEPARVTRRQAPANSTHHTVYNGTVLFRNTFDGKLPASDYPKVNVCVRGPYVGSDSDVCVTVLLLNVPCVLRVGHRMGLALLSERTGSPSHTGL